MGNSYLHKSIRNLQRPIGLLSLHHWQCISWLHWSICITGGVVFEIGYYCINYLLKDHTRVLCMAGKSHYKEYIWTWWHNINFRLFLSTKEPILHYALHKKLCKEALEALFFPARIEEADTSYASHQGILYTYIANIASSLKSSRS